MDDFLIPVRVARAGTEIVFAGDAVAREDAARDVAAEVSRRFRIGIGAGQVLRRETLALNAGAHPLLTLAFLSRKAARWLAPLSGAARPPSRPSASPALAPGRGGRRSGLPSSCSASARAAAAPARARRGGSIISAC